MWSVATEKLKLSKSLALCSYWTLQCSQDCVNRDPQCCHWIFWNHLGMLLYRDKCMYQVVIPEDHRLTPKMLPFWKLNLFWISPLPHLHPWWSILQGSWQVPSEKKPWDSQLLFWCLHALSTLYLQQHSFQMTLAYFKPAQTVQELALIRIFKILYYWLSKKTQHCFK